MDAAAFFASWLQYPAAHPIHRMRYPTDHSQILNFVPFVRVIAVAD